MENNTIVAFLINGLLGVVMYFMNASNKALSERIAKTEQSIDDLKESTFKKEDFKEFKMDLFVRLDRIEAEWTRRLEQTNKDKHVST